MKPILSHQIPGSAENQQKDGRLYFKEKGDARFPPLGNDSHIIPHPGKKGSNSELLKHF